MVMPVNPTPGPSVKPRAETPADSRVSREASGIRERTAIRQTLADEFNKAMMQGGDVAEAAGISTEISTDIFSLDHHEQGHGLHGDTPLVSAGPLTELATNATPIELNTLVERRQSAGFVNEVVQAMMIEIDRRKNDNRPRHWQFQIDSAGSNIASVELVEKAGGGWQVHVGVHDAAAARRAGLGTDSEGHEADALDALKLSLLERLGHDTDLQVTEAGS